MNLHKLAEIALREGAAPTVSPSQALGVETLRLTKGEEVDPAFWPLEEINRRAVVLTVESSVLGGAVLFVPNGWRRPNGEARLALRVADLQKLATIRPKAVELRQIAETLRVFEGRIA